MPPSAPAAESPLPGAIDRTTVAEMLRMERDAAYAAGREDGRLESVARIGDLEERMKLKSQQVDDLREESSILRARFSEEVDNARNSARAEVQRDLTEARARIQDLSTEVHRLQIEAMEARLRAEFGKPSGSSLTEILGNLVRQHGGPLIAMMGQIVAQQQAQRVVSTPLPEYAGDGHALPPQPPPSPMSPLADAVVTRIVAAMNDPGSAPVESILADLRTLLQGQQFSTAEWGSVVNAVLDLGTQRKVSPGVLAPFVDPLVRLLDDHMQQAAMMMPVQAVASIIESATGYRFTPDGRALFEGVIEHLKSQRRQQV